jgi:quercetin dioxygenase-like cupin family protein
MSTRSENPEQTEASEQIELNELIMEGLAPIEPSPQRQRALRARLMERVALSAAQHAGLLTVRRKDGRWRTIKAGVRLKHLWTGLAGSSVLIEFAPGTALPAHRHNWVEEGIVLQGGLQMDDLDMGPFDYHMSPAGSRHGLIRSRQGALAYLRGTSLGHTASVVRELLGGLLPSRGEPTHTVFSNEEGWEQLGPGVQKKELWSDGTLTSGFCRFAPGARFPGHAHPVEEECMMLSGEVFLGDILLSAGDYQLAVAGSMHGEVFSEVGALFFFRGAIEGKGGRKQP